MNDDKTITDDLSIYAKTIETIRNLSNLAVNGADSVTDALVWFAAAFTLASSELIVKSTDVRSYE